MGNGGWQGQTWPGGPNEHSPTTGPSFHSAPTPAYGSTPSGGAASPTPAYDPSAARARPHAPSPAQRLADAKATPRRVRSSANPDGAPAPLPPAARGGKGAGRAAGGGRVVQRFSGTGLPQRTRTEQRERRAKRATLTLAALAILLIAGSAFLLFDPTSLLDSFGFALGQRIHTTNSDIPLLVDGTQPNQPTHTPTSSAGAGSPTPPGAGTPKPTATPSPSPTATRTPTPTPTVPANGAVVSFTMSPPQTLTSNGAMTACGSASCTFRWKSTSGSAQGSYFKQYVSGYHGSQWSASLYVTVGQVQSCTANWQVCQQVNTWPGGTVTFTVTGQSCMVYVPALTVGNGATASGTCTVYDSYSNDWGSYLPSGATNGSGCGSTGNTYAGYQGCFSFSSNQGSAVFAGNWYYYPTNSDCAAAINNAWPSADANARNAIKNWGNGLLGVQTTNLSHGSASCWPAPGNPGGSVTGYANDNYSAVAFSAQDAQNVAAQRIAAMLPANDYWATGPTTCSPTWSYSGQYNITCADSGGAQYDWRSSSSAGQAAQAALQKALAGLPLSQAQDVCNNKTQGVTPGTCTITLTGGNVAILPSSPSAIQIRPS